MILKTVTEKEKQQGYVLCNCGKYVHAFKAEVVRRLPEGYTGELCTQCYLWMIATNKLPVKFEEPECKLTRPPA